MRRKVGTFGDIKVLPEDQGKGLVEAIVAVFGNVDLAGDRIVKGAFSKSLETWKASGDPIPCVYSHLWDNIDAHCGEVVAAVELGPGDARLPEHLKDLGGLWCQIQFDVEEDYARKVFSRIRKRRIKNWSFAYDVVDEEPVDGANELRELKLIEVGPTLIGANMATDTVGAKSGRVLSRKNETKLREVETLVQEILATLESTDEDEGKAIGQADDATPSSDGEKAIGEAGRAMTPSTALLLVRIAIAEVA